VVLARLALLAAALLAVAVVVDDELARQVRQVIVALATVRSGRYLDITAAISSHGVGTAR
jgi:hypothetical protein